MPGRLAGDTIYLRGQIGQNLDTSENVGVGDITAQTEQAMTNIDLLLREASSSLQTSSRSPSTSSTPATASRCTG